MGSNGILQTLLTGVVSGTLVALVSYFLARKKTAAEIKKLEAETDKIRAEIGDVKSLSASVSYGLAAAAEQVLYSNVAGDVGFDFEGRGAKDWRTVDGKSVATGEKAQGQLTFEPGAIINIRRENTDGRYELWLRRYFYNGHETAFLPQDDAISGKRRLRLNCEAKVVGAPYRLDFILKNEKADRWLGHEERTVSEATWTPVQIYYSVAGEECRLRIDVRTGVAPSSIQIRNLVLAQRA